MNYYQKIWETVQEGNTLVLERSWQGKSGSVKDLSCRLFTGEDYSAPCPSDEPGEAATPAEEAYQSGELCMRRTEDYWEAAEPFYPRERLIVLGGGHVALPVVTLGAMAGFQVVVVDDRSSFANTQRFPAASQVICDEFTSAIAKLEIKPSDYVVVITRGHRCDADCLRVLCKGVEPAYLGMMGSSRRVAIVKQRMISEGYDADRLNRMHSPIGLRIGALTPEELAICILGEIIKVKRLERKSTRQGGCSDLDYDVLETLAKEEGVPKAVLTVLQTDGSSPRGAGAKMIVYRDGRILGSIGGGCPEAEALTAARKLIGTGKYQVIHLDMTADGSEGGEEAVCGGVMDVLAEDVTL